MWQKILDAIVAFLSGLFAGSDHEATPSESMSSGPSADPMAWGARVDPEFRQRVRELCDDLEINPDHLMACIAFESAETFRPDIRNYAGSGATGLIQFMPATAKGLGTSTDELAAMTAVEQLEFVRRYFRPYRGKLSTLADVYMAILWPRGIGKPADWVLWDSETRPTTYRQNAGLDLNRDGVITKAEAAAKVRDKLEKGLRPENTA